MIELFQLTKYYPSGIKALDDINLKIKKGEIFGIIGPSGAGKSTLIRCINLLEKPSSGTIVIENQDIIKLSSSELREVRKKIGMIFQHFNLLSSRTVYQNIAFPLEISGVKNSHIQKIVNPLLELTGLTDKRNFYPSHLSGGQKQRVGIARALANNPKVILSDEATSALDPQTTRSILKLLKDINQELKITILLITHEMEVVKEVCHRLAILENGRIIEQSNVLEFFSNPKSDTAKQFIRSSIRHALPESIQKRLIKKNGEANLLLRFSFVGRSTQEPLIANLIRNYGMTINILQANIELIRDELFGFVVVETSISEPELHKAMAYLSTQGVHVEELGYVTK
jgi:D-methionine transport system ATP-binding protein